MSTPHYESACGFEGRMSRRDRLYRMRTSIPEVVVRFSLLLLRTGHSCRCPPSRRARRGSSSLRGPMVSNTGCPLGCVGGLTTCSVFHSSTHFTTRTSPRKGVLLKRLRLFAQRCRSPLSVFRSCQTFDGAPGFSSLPVADSSASGGLLARPESRRGAEV